MPNYKAEMKKWKIVINIECTNDGINTINKMINKVLKDIVYEYKYKSESTNRYYKS